MDARETLYLRAKQNEKHENVPPTPVPEKRLQLRMVFSWASVCPPARVRRETEMPDSPVYIYTVSVRSTDRDYLTVAPSVDAAQAGIEERFKLAAGDAKAKTLKLNGLPARCYLHPLISGSPAATATTEQCWSERNDGTARCQNPARPGFHTCKIHTSYDAPYPFGTPELNEWLAKELAGDDETAPKPAKRRSGATTPKTRRKPAKRRAAPRDELK